MNIKALSQINTGFGNLQPGELATLPDADALRCIKCGAAEPADRRARKIVAAANEAEQAALELAAAQIDTTGQDPSPRDSSGFVLALQVRTANLGNNSLGGPGRFGGI